MEEFIKLIETYFNQEFGKNDKEIGERGNEFVSVQTLWLKTKDEGMTLTIEREPIFAPDGLLITLHLGGQRGNIFTVQFREVFQVRVRSNNLDIIGQTVNDKLVIIRINKDREIQVL